MNVPPTATHKSTEQGDPIYWYIGVFAFVAIFLGTVLWRGVARYEESVNLQGSMATNVRSVEAIQGRLESNTEVPGFELKRKHGRIERPEFARSAAERLDTIQNRIDLIEEGPRVRKLNGDIDKLSKQATKVSREIKEFEDPDSTVTQDEVEMSLNDMEDSLDGLDMQLSLAR